MTEKYGVRYHMMKLGLKRDHDNSSELLNHRFSRNQRYNPSYMLVNKIMNILAQMWLLTSSLFILII
jgi:hypothetical protein